MQKITPFLWFDDKAEEAANFYTSIFKNAKIGKITPCSSAPSSMPFHLLPSWARPCSPGTSAVQLPSTYGGLSII
jgi:hypothetical protein